MGKVVFGEEQFHLERIAGGVERFQRVADEFLKEEFFLYPDRDEREELGEPFRREGVVGLEQALELQERLVVEDHGVEFRHRHPGVGEAEFGRFEGKVGVLFDTGEAFFLRGGDDATVGNEGGGGVVVKG